jgi:phage terminase small subunit
MNSKAKNLFALIKKPKIKNNIRSKNLEMMMKLKMISQELQVNVKEKRKSMGVVSF